jgi:6,7-dimethyl-8-ribityllumazine synthase
MLRQIQRRKGRPQGGAFVIVASRYHARYVNAMVSAAKTELHRAQASGIRIVRVPGAFEIPIAVKRLASAGHSRAGASLSAIICLGVIFRGETVHAAHIGQAVSRALMEIQLTHEIPVIHEVLLLENEGQARVRCLSQNHNRGTEAAQTALAMARVMADLNIHV